LSIEIELDPNNILQRSIPTRCASLILTSSKRGKGHKKGHFWPAVLWRGDLSTSPTKKKPEAHKNLKSTKHHATTKCNVVFHSRNPPGIKNET
jgi:hypothetical protein